MNNILKLSCFLTLYVFCLLPSKAQHIIDYSSDLYAEMDDSTKKQILGSLDSLFNCITNDTDYNNFLSIENIDISGDYFQNIKDIIKSDTVGKPILQIINLYKITGEEQYSITITYNLNNRKDNSSSSVNTIFTLIAEKQDESFVFKTPIKLRTKGWSTKTIDEITFHYPNVLNHERANNFVRKNRDMAKNLNFPIKHFEVYVTNNYQEILFLQGIDYSFPNNGIINRGYIIDPNILFSVMGNENFSHDVLHIYAGQIRTKRNTTAEEGLAYIWGDAYYADPSGYIPNQNDLIIELRKYLDTHPTELILDVFIKNPRIFKYTTRISPKSVISGAICTKIEETKGHVGIIELLQCGAGDDNYFESINKLVSINKENFENKVRPLIYKD